MEEKGINNIIELDKRQFNNKKKYFEFILKEIERHILLLRDLEEKKETRLRSEIIDVYVWAKILLKTEKINKKEVNKRISYFKKKIIEKRG